MDSAVLRLSHADMVQAMPGRDFLLASTKEDPFKRVDGYLKVAERWPTDSEGLAAMVRAAVCLKQLSVEWTWENRNDLKSAGLHLRLDALLTKLPPAWKSDPRGLRALELASEAATSRFESHPRRVRAHQSIPIPSPLLRDATIRIYRLASPSDSTDTIEQGLAVPELVLPIPAGRPGQSIELPGPGVYWMEFQSEGHPWIAPVLAIASDLDILVQELDAQVVVLCLLNGVPTPGVKVALTKLHDSLTQASIISDANGIAKL
jgi:hypothetical protein